MTAPFPLILHFALERKMNKRGAALLDSLGQIPSSSTCWWYKPLLQLLPEISYQEVYTAQIIQPFKER